MGFPDPGVWMTFQVLTQEAESYVFKNWECGINMCRRVCVCLKDPTKRSLSLIWDHSLELQIIMEGALFTSVCNIFWLKFC